MEKLYNGQWHPFFTTCVTTTKNEGLLATIPAGHTAIKAPASESSPLHIVIIGRGDVSSISDLLDCGADVNARNKYGETPLHYAAQIGNNEIVSLLLKNKANPTHKDHGKLFIIFKQPRIESNSNTTDGNIPLHWAASSTNSIGVCIKLLSKFKPTSLINETNLEGSTPLMIAIQNGNYDSVKKLVKLKANIGNGLRLADECDETKIRKFLISRSVSAKLV